MTEVNTAKEAIEYILGTRTCSKYSIAKTVGVTPAMINRYLAGHQCSARVAGMFKAHYGVEVVSTREVGKP